VCLPINVQSRRLIGSILGVSVSRDALGTLAMVNGEEKRTQISKLTWGINQYPDPCPWNTNELHPLFAPLP
jgi:hypothetical protein